MSSKRIRADQLLVEQGLAQSRERAKRLIMAGQVQLVHDTDTRERVGKPGQQLPPDARLEVSSGQRYVSRGGEKLETALEHFDLEVTGLTCLDVGASTGGFTDCLLQHGASLVYAVDVGYGQLDWKLRSDPRVVTLERVNFRHAPPDLIPEAVDLVTIDCSFISLHHILPPCLNFLKEGGLIIALIKPQFEVGRGRTDKGVVRSEALQQEAVTQVIGFAVHDLGLGSLGVVPARVKGPKGNQEFLALLKRGGTSSGSA